MTSCVCDNNKNFSLLHDYLYTSSYVDIKQIDCRHCKKCTALETNGIVQSPQEWLSNPKSISGWQVAKSAQDYTIVYVLSQLMHNGTAAEDEALFDMPDPCDIVKIYWNDGTAVAYYTTKTEGTLDPITTEKYEHNTLDTAFVVPSWRRKGIGVAMVEDMAKNYPGKDLAVSSPISDSMKKVLLKFLKENPHYKMKLWQLNSTARGDRSLIHYNVRR